MEAHAHPEDRRARVTIETSGYTCEGLVHLPGIRLSDVMNEKNQFLIVVKAVMLGHATNGEPQRSMQAETVFINKNDIRFVIPKEGEERIPRF